jgi:hypothetical protein
MGIKPPATEGKALDLLSSAEIGNLIAEKEKELKTMLKAKEVLDLREIELARAILQLRMEKKDVEAQCLKASTTIRTLALDLKGLVSRFWAARQSGI